MVAAPIGLGLGEETSKYRLRGRNLSFGGKASHHPQPRSVFLSLRHPHAVQKSPRFGGAKFFRNHDRSGLNHVLGRPYCCVGARVVQNDASEVVGCQRRNFARNQMRFCMEL